MRLSIFFFATLFFFPTSGLGICQDDQSGARQLRFFGEVLSCILDPAVSDTLGLCPDISSDSNTQLLTLNMTNPVSDSLNLSFPFNFFGTNYSSLTVSRTGVISFGEPLFLVPTTCFLEDTSSDVIYGVHGDFDPGAPGAQIMYLAQDDRFIISFLNVPFNSQTSPNSWTTVLNSDRSFSTCVRSIQTPIPDEGFALNGIHDQSARASFFTDCPVAEATYYYETNFIPLNSDRTPRFFQEDCFNECFNGRTEPCVTWQLVTGLLVDLQAQNTFITRIDDTLAGVVTPPRFLTIFDLVQDPGNLTLIGRLTQDDINYFIPFDERYAFILARDQVLLFNLNFTTSIQDSNGGFFNLNRENQVNLGTEGANFSSATFSRRHGLLYTVDAPPGQEVAVANTSNLPFFNQVDSTEIEASADVAIDPEERFLARLTLLEENRVDVFELNADGLFFAINNIPLPIRDISGMPRDVDLTTDRILALVGSSLIMWDTDCVLREESPESCLLSTATFPIDDAECLLMDLEKSDPSLSSPNRIVVTCNAGWLVYDFSTDDLRLVSRYDAQDELSQILATLNIPSSQIVLQDYILENNFIFATAGSNGLIGFCAGTTITRDPPSDSLTAGEIAGIVIATLFGCCCISLIVWGLIVLLVKSKVLVQRSKLYEEENYEIPSVHISKNLTREKFLTGVSQGKVIGKGAFGTVYQGSWEQIDVALKGIEGDDLELEYSVLTSLSHPHIIRCFGLCKLEDDTYMVLELMKGDLLTELQTNPSLAKKELPSMAYQTALGMKYLHDQDILHRDLACRNLLFIKSDNSYGIKVSDFGLSRQTNYYKATTKGKIPYKWSSPEAIKFQKFTFASDVWAYGIVIWEIFSRGAVPYPTTDNEELLEKLENGFRLKFNNTPKEWEDLAMSCWAADPQDRPSFPQLIKKIPSSPIPRKITATLSQRFSFMPTPQGSESQLGSSSTYH